MMGVFRLFVVLAGMSVFAGIAATGVAAGEALADLDPRIAGFFAVIASLAVGGDGIDLVQVRAACFSRHRSPD